MANIFICIFFAIGLLYGETEISRFPPRLLRELQRGSVNWRGKLESARSADLYQKASGTAIHIISLSRTPARRAWLESNLENFGAEFQVFNAVDGTQQFDYDDLKKYAGLRKRQKISGRLWGDKLPSSAKRTLHERLRFGCYLSHVRLWEWQNELKVPHQIILEDDARPCEGFLSAVETSIQKLPFDWDIFYLDSCHTKLGGLLCPGIKQVKGALCTHGYVLSSGGATKLLSKYALESEKPVDHMLDEAIYTAGFSAYHADPPLVTRVDLKSTLAYPS